MTPEEAIKEFESELEWAELNMYPYVSKQKIEADKMAIDALKQEAKTGHWIIIDDCEQFIAKCSECGEIVDSRMISKYPYCHCGAKMLKPQERGVEE